MLPVSLQGESCEELPGAEAEVSKEKVEEGGDNTDNTSPATPNGAVALLAEPGGQKSPQPPDTCSVSSLRRTTSRSSIASVRSRILVNYFLI